jgi:hypothetical protein
MVAKVPRGSPPLSVMVKEGTILISSSTIDLDRTSSTLYGFIATTGSVADVRTVSKFIDGVPSKWKMYLISTAFVKVEGMPSNLSNTTSDPLIIKESEASSIILYDVDQ